MRALVQRVTRASVSVDGQTVGRIKSGILVLLGVGRTDTDADAEYLANRCAALRIFEDTAGKMNLSLSETGGEALVVSQFTLYGDTRKGNRPGYSEAAPPEQVESFYNHFVVHFKKILGDSRVATGVFRAMMAVELINDGPVTLMIESKQDRAAAENETGVLPLPNQKAVS
jgi:D-tyrosyl-tRNA(Tyr) deacylase